VAVLDSVAKGFDTTASRLLATCGKSALVASSFVDPNLTQALSYLSMPISAQDGVFIYPQSTSHISVFLVIANNVSHLSFSNIITHFSLPISLRLPLLSR
jgi:hypothetical protein